MKLMLAHFPDIHTVYQNLALCHVKKPWNQVYQRRFTASGTSNNCCCFTRSCRKVQIRKYIFFGFRIGKGNIFKFNDTFLASVCLLRIFRIMENHFCCQYLINTRSRYTGSRQHNGKHGKHQEGHYYHHGILDKCHQITDLHISIVNSGCTFPYYQYCNTVHDKHHKRHHKRHTAVNKKICLH